MPDLITIPGIPQLWTRTQGDRGIKIAILDGAADLERACFKGANITQFKPYWSEDIELNDEYYYYLKLATEFNQQQKAKKEADPDHDKEEAKKETEAFFAQFPEQIQRRIDLSSHATHIASIMLGQHGSPVLGIAPHCTAINIPISFAGDDFISPINLTHAINEALKAGANIIHIAACQPTQTGISHDLFARAVKQCQDNNILIVAPGGNDKGECWCIPAILPGVLTVGAIRDDGQPFKFSNYGGDYQNKGVMANGENILGAQPGTDEPIREKGTSCAAPIVTGISALLMSMQLQRGEKPNAEAVRQAILNSAIPCDPEEVEEPERCLMGKLNIPGAFQLLTGEPLIAIRPSSTTPPEINFSDNTVTPANTTRPEIYLADNTVTIGNIARPEIYLADDNTVTPANIARPEINFHSLSESPLKRNKNQIESSTLSGINVSNYEEKFLVKNPINSPLKRSLAISQGIDSLADGKMQPSNATVATITPSAASKLVYALGTIGYDFGSEARRDTFKQLMPAVEIDGIIIPPNPYDARQMVDYLSENPSEAKALIWTLNQELTPIYALEPRQGFSADVYETLIMMLAGQIEPEDSDDFVERVSIPAKTADKTVQLFSGQEVPIITLINTRGMYGWKVNGLVEAALQIVAPQAPQADEIAMRKSLTSFLNRVYFDFKNLGQTSKDRALNFSVTNAFQAASSFAEAISRGMQLDTIEVEKSPFCRINSDCWDVILKFFDPENGLRAKKVYRFTVDVSDRIPVTLGEVRSWSVPK